MNPSEGLAGELATEYFHMIQNKVQMEDNYKAIIDNGKKCQNDLKDALKGITLKSEALYILGVTVLCKEIWEYSK